MLSPSFALHPKGRFNRLSYLSWMSTVLCLVLITFGWMFYYISYLPFEENTFETTNFLLINLFAQLIQAVTLTLIIISGIRRINDLGKSAWLLLLLLFPIINLFLVIYLCIFAGDSNDNSHGSYRATTVFEKALLAINILVCIGMCIFIYNLGFWHEPTPLFDHKS